MFIGLQEQENMEFARKRGSKDKKKRRRRAMVAGAALGGAALGAAALAMRKGGIKKLSGSNPKMLAGNAKLLKGKLAETIGGVNPKEGMRTLAKGRAVNKESQQAMRRAALKTGNTKLAKSQALKGKLAETMSAGGINPREGMKTLAKGRAGNKQSQQTMRRVMKNAGRIQKSKK